MITRRSKIKSNENKYVGKKREWEELLLDK